MKQKQILAELVVFYLRYRILVVAGFIILITIFVVIQIMIPQILLVQQTRQAITEKEEDVSELSATLQNLKSIDDSILNGNVSTVKAALPEAKDFVVIFLALESAAQRAGVVLGDFTLKIGPVYTNPKNADATAAPVTPVVDTAETVAGALQLTLKVKIDTDDPFAMNKFSQYVFTTLPLAEVNIMNTDEKGADYEITFFYKPYNLTALAGSTVVNLLNPKELKLLQEIEGMKIEQPTEPVPVSN